MSQNCQRCGAMLPENQDEGLCPVCGTPFGARTVAMAVTLADLEAAHRQTQAARQSAASNPPPAGVPAAKAAAGVPMALIVGLALVLSALVLVFVALLVLRS